MDRVATVIVRGVGLHIGRVALVLALEGGGLENREPVVLECVVIDAARWEKGGGTSCFKTLAGAKREEMKSVRGKRVLEWKRRGREVTNHLGLNNASGYFGGCHPEWEIDLLGRLCVGCFGGKETVAMKLFESL